MPTLPEGIYPTPTLSDPIPTYMSDPGRFREYPETCKKYVLHKVILTYPFRDHFMWVWSPCDLLGTRD